jgi:hypothetical protein
MAVKSFITLSPGIELINPFRFQLAQSFLKAISFSQERKIMVTLIKWSSFQKSVSKKFDEIAPSAVSLPQGDVILTQPA